VAITCVQLGVAFVATRIEHELEAPARGYRNQTIQFGKSDSPLLAGPTAVRGFHKKLLL
jgi:hypothetical protein